MMILGRMRFAGLGLALIGAVGALAVAAVAPALAAPANSNPPVADHKSEVPAGPGTLQPGFKVVPPGDQVEAKDGDKLIALKGARVWGDSVPRPGQSVRLDHLIEADDRVYLQS